MLCGLVLAKWLGWTGSNKVRISPLFFNFKFILVIFWNGPQALTHAVTAVSPAVIILIQGCSMVSYQP